MERFAKLSGWAGQGLLAAVRAVAGELRARLEGLGGSGARRRRMRVVESLALGGRRQLMLVVCDGQEYLVGTGPESVETIVLRQPTGLPVGSGADPAGLAPAGWAQAGLAQMGLAQAGSAQAGLAQGPSGTATRATGVARPRITSRARNVPGPWLVTPKVRGSEANRIRETGNGKGRELWQ